jgi:hypothetical protein
MDNPGFPIGVINFTRGRRNLPNLPVSTILGCAQKPINSTNFLGADPGTVLFNGGRAHRRVWSNTSTISASGGVWDVEYSFTVRPQIPWDHIATRDSGTNYSFKKVKFNNGDPFIGRSDLNVLLT